MRTGVVALLALALFLCAVLLADGVTRTLDALAACKATRTALRARVREPRARDDFSILEAQRTAARRPRGVARTSVPRRG